MKPWPAPNEKPENRFRLAFEFVGLGAVIIFAIAASLVFGVSRVWAEPPIIETGEVFSCTPVAVWDGDGPIWCAEGPRVRLNAIAAREIDGTCRSGHPCHDATGVASRDHLASLLGRSNGRLSHGHIRIEGPPLRCRSSGSAGGTRTAARCVSPTHGDIGCRMVRDGYALQWRQYGEACLDGR